MGDRPLVAGQAGARHRADPDLHQHLLSRLGIQVMLEDYVHEEAGKIAAWLLVNIVPFAAGAFGVVSVIRIALGAA
jgi:hypothetical protein